MPTSGARGKPFVNIPDCLPGLQAFAEADDEMQAEREEVSAEPGLFWVMRRRSSKPERLSSRLSAWHIEGCKGSLLLPPFPSGHEGRPSVLGVC